jgi:hypothetical protein
MTKNTASGGLKCVMQLLFIENITKLVLTWQPLKLEKKAWIWNPCTLEIFMYVV